MRVFAYCAASFAEATRRAAGVEPVTCPPVWWQTFDPANLAGQDLIYLDLHGEPGEPCWRGDEGLIALTIEQLGEVNLGGAAVFAANCYLAEDDSPMLDALLEAGAAYVVGGDGQNYAGRHAVFGAGLLGLWFRRWLQIGLGPMRALAMARRRVRLAALVGRKRDEARDTLGFRAYYREVM